MANKPEITAEWTVHAQLTLSHSANDNSENKQDNENKTSENINAENNVNSESNKPVNVVYKFSSADPNSQGQTHDGGNSAFKRGNIFSSESPSAQHTPKTGDDSDHHSTNIGQSLFNPKCTSTCSIVLTACTDLYHQNSENVVFRKATSTSFTDQPNIKIYNAKDVSCQTSDLEINVDKLVQTFDDCEKRKKFYDYRRITDSMLSPSMSRKGGKRGSPPTRRSHSPTDFMSPNSTLLSQHSSNKDKGEKKKPPRTVHIDVYCTGSDAGSSSGNDEKSSSPSSHGSNFSTNIIEEIKSNSENPTFETSEIRLKHKRVGKHELPRRLQIDQNQSTLSTQGSLKKSSSNGRKLTKSNTKEEINESKQILFNKHLGKQNQISDFDGYKSFERNASDDCISSNYPYSSRSTRRDITGSSLSSALASVSAIFEENEMDPEFGFKKSQTTITQSDSFEYENSEDRFRIKEMENLWSDKQWKSPSTERKLLGKAHDSDSDNNLSESDHSFIYENSSKPNDSNQSENLSDSSPSTVKSYSTRHTDVSNKNNDAKTFETNSLTSTLQSHLAGYTDEYLMRARRFGNVICGKRKPGVHIGPVRNPECQCEHCKRWVLDKEKGRERAMSVDQVPANIIDIVRRRLKMQM